MALADLAVAAQQWVEDEFRRSDSEGVRFLHRLADEVEAGARVLVPVDTSGTFDSIHVEEVTGHDGIHYFKVLARNPQTDVLDSAHGYIRNPGKRTGELTRTGRRRRARGSGRTVRESHPFMREALLDTFRTGF